MTGSALGRAVFCAAALATVGGAPDAASAPPFLGLPCDTLGSTPSARTPHVVGRREYGGYCHGEDNSGRVHITVTAGDGREALEVLGQDTATPSIVYTGLTEGEATYSVVATPTGYSAPTPRPYRDFYVVNVPAPPAPLPAVSPPLVSPLRALPARFGLARLPATVRVDARGRAVVTATGPPGGRGAVTIASAKPVGKHVVRLGGKRFRLPSSGVVAVRVKLSGRGLAVLERSKRLAAKVTVTGGSSSVSRRTTLRAPKARRGASTRR